MMSQRQEAMAGTRARHEKGIGERKQIVVVVEVEVEV